ncbi:hypothetical protein [Sphaerisporangium dianthi]|uniref:Uncharacterized protein n=1 Tax=Sphaerisporangium dianthi TaxID=1436120 RepID=A0ABV9CBB8_9ACTN
MDARNPRHNRHAAGPYPPAGRPSGLTMLWRRRSEIMAAAGVLTLGVLAYAAHGWWGFGLVTGAVAAPVTVRAGRGRIMAHLRCVYSRHRMQRLFLDAPLHTARGRVPLILWITPTRAGEKALILCRVGICAETFEAFAGELASACGAVTARVARHHKWSTLVTVEIVRRHPRPVGAPVGMDRLLSDPSVWPPLGEPTEEPRQDDFGGRRGDDPWDDLLDGRREEAFAWHRTAGR